MLSPELRPDKLRSASFRWCHRFLSSDDPGYDITGKGTTNSRTALRTRPFWHNGKCFAAAPKTEEKGRFDGCGKGVEQR